MNELQIIEQRELLGQDFKIYGDFENPLFLAKDVAEWIEHNKPNELVAVADENEKLKATISLSGQNREMWFLTEDGLYEVLMQSRKPIAKQFKKQVKVILREIRQTGSYGRTQQIPTSPRELIQLALAGTEEVNQRVDDIENKLEDLTDRMGLPSNQKYTLINIRRKHVVTLLGGKDSNAYPEISKKVFSEMGHDFKEYFEVTRYEDVPLSRFDEAVEYTKTWQPSTNTAMTIRRLNSQGRLFEEV